MTDPTPLEEILRQFSALLPKRDEEWVSNSTYDFVLRFGRKFRAFTPSGGFLHPDYEHLRGPVGNCFQNAALVVLENRAPELTYVEGYAISAAGFPIPIHHAWLVDLDLEVVDITWPEAGCDYFGVPFPKADLLTGILKLEQYGLLDAWEQGCPYEKYGLTGAPERSEAR